MKIFDTVAALKLAVLSSGQFVSTREYFSGDGVGSSNYEILTSGEYAATPDEFGDHTITNGNIAVLRGLAPSLYQLGCRPGDFDNAPALKAAIENTHRVVSGHEGNIFIKSPVDATLSVEKSIIGIGQGRRSNIKYQDPSALIKITSPNIDFLLTIAGVGFTAGVNTTGAALEIVYPDEGFVSRRQVTISSVDMIGDVSGTDFFNDSLILTNVHQSSIIDCTIQGNSANKSEVLTGLTLNGTCVGVTVANCQINNFLTGINLEGNCKDTLINNCRLTQNITCLRSIMDTVALRFILSSCSLTGEISGVVIDNMEDVLLTGCRVDKSGASSDNYTDFVIDNVVGLTVSDNVTSGLGLGGTETGITCDTVTNAAIHDNVFRERALLISLDANCTRIAGSGNVGDVGSTTLVDLGSGNSITEAFV